MANNTHGSQSKKSLWRFDQNSKNKDTHINSKFRYGYFDNLSKELSVDTLPALYILLRTARENKISQLETLFDLFDDKNALRTLFSVVLKKNAYCKFLN